MPSVEGVGKGVLVVIVVDHLSSKHPVRVPVTIVPGLGRHLFYGPQSPEFQQSATPAPTFFSKANVRNRHRETPLLLAVRAGSSDAVTALLASGARLDEPDASGEIHAVGAIFVVTLSGELSRWRSIYLGGICRRGEGFFLFVFLVLFCIGIPTFAVGKRLNLADPLTVSLKGSSVGTKKGQRRRSAYISCQPL